MRRLNFRSVKRARTFALLLFAGWLVICFQNFSTVVPKHREFDFRTIVPQRPKGYVDHPDALFATFHPNTGDSSINALASDWFTQTSHPLLRRAKQKLQNFVAGGNQTVERAPQSVANSDGSSTLRFQWANVNTIRLIQKNGIQMQCQATPNDLVFRLSEPIAWDQGEINFEHHTASDETTLNLGWSW